MNGGEAMANTEFMTTSEAAKFLGCKRGALWTWAREGRLQAYRSIASKQNLYRRADIEVLAVPQPIIVEQQAA